MVGHGGSSAGSYLANPTSPIPSHCASIVVTSTLRVKFFCAPCSCKTSFSYLLTKGLIQQILRGIRFNGIPLMEERRDLCLQDL